MQTNIINPVEVKNQLEALANDIERSDKKAANRLHNLRVAVGKGNNADAWAASDIIRLINPDQIVENYKNQPTADAFISALEWGRNILIFLPLLVSWFGISQAVSRYSDFVGKHQDQITQPFLYLWQTGFGGELSGWLTLGSLAAIDAFLLALLVTVTIVHTSLADIGRQRRFQAAERLRADLSDTLAGATLCLTTRNWQQPQNFVDTFDQSSRFFKDAIEKLLARIEILAQRQNQEHQIFTGLSNDLQRIMGTVSGAVVDLKNSNDALRQSMGQLVAPTQKISTNLEIVGAASQSLLTEYTQLKGRLENIITTLNAWGTSLTNTLGDLNNAVVAGKNLANSVNNITQQNQALHKDVANTLTSQNNLTGKMVDASDNMRQFAADLANCLTEFKAFNIQIEEFIRRVAILTQKLPPN